MLSVVLIGRNDEHGYNLHKRVALSLNSIAEQLGTNDEIVFVDYNTPRGLPTLPETISDTLTEHCRGLIRVLRVWPDVHNSRVLNSSRPILEALARNVGIRRTNPTNTWVLSTNTDILVCPSAGQSLSDYAEHLDLGAWYGLPRYSLPDSYWDSLPRTDPLLVTDQLGRDKARLGLEERIVYDGHMLFDAPGDFQLVPRRTLVDLGGFDERMIYGWHVDANLSMRLGRTELRPLSLESAFQIFHCEHTRLNTHFANHSRVNDPQEFAGDQAIEWAGGDLWGLGATPIEEIRLNGLSEFGAGRALALTSGQSLATFDTPHTVNARDAARLATVRDIHVAPFLLDSIRYLAPQCAVGYLGGHFASVGPSLSRTSSDGAFQQVTVSQVTAPQVAAIVRHGSQPLTALDALIVDFRATDDSGATANQRYWSDFSMDARIAVLTRLWILLVIVRRTGHSDTPLSAATRFILINASGNRIDAIVSEVLQTAPATFNARVRYGLVSKRKRGKVELNLGSSQTPQPGHPASSASQRRAQWQLLKAGLLLRRSWGSALSGRQALRLALLCTDMGVPVDECCRIPRSQEPA